MRWVVSDKAWERLSAEQRAYYDPPRFWDGACCNCAKPLVGERPLECQECGWINCFVTPIKRGAMTETRPDPSIPENVGSLASTGTGHYAYPGEAARQQEALESLRFDFAAGLS
jgi:hypothetical protein